jgi:hypothetical protein
MFFYYTLHVFTMQRIWDIILYKDFMGLLAKKSKIIYLKSLNEIFCFTYTRHCFNVSLVVWLSLMNKHSIFKCACVKTFFEHCNVNFWGTFTTAIFHS